MAEAALQPKEEIDFTDMAVGEILRRTRAHYNQSIEDIEKALRIRACQIEAIEQGDLDALPGRVYAIGFVRAYAEYLGLDGDKMVNLFKHQASSVTSETELHFPMPASDSKIPPAWITILCILAIGSVLVFWIGGDAQQREAVEVIPPVSEKIEAVQPVEAIEVEAGEVAQKAKPAADPVIEKKTAKGIILNIRENSWVEIRDKKGKAMLSRVLKAGDQYYVPDRPDLTISIGNAGGVEIEVDGKALRKLGEKGQVLRRLSLDAKYLKNNFALETSE